MPNVSSTPDGVIDVLDLMIFTTMLNWYAAQDFAASIELPDPVNSPHNTSTDDGEFVSEFLRVTSNRLGDRLVVEYFAHEISDLMVAELIMLYDSDDYSLLSINKGDFLNNGIFSGYEKANGVQVYIGNLDRVSPGVSGSGKLMELELDILGDVEDNFIIGFDLRNSAGDIIEAGGLSVGTNSPRDFPVEYALYAAYPNPFNSQTRVMFGMPQPGRATVAIYNLQEQKVSSLIEDFMQAGTHTAYWNAQGFPTGTYIIRFTADSKMTAQKLILIK
mgnify:CR=1 FL=1